VTKTIKLDFEGSKQRVELDGQDISKHVSSATLTAKAGHFAEVTLSLTPLQVAAEADAVIKIPAEMEEILMELGWTPPGNCAGGCR